MATEATVGTAIGQRGLFKDEAKAGGGQEDRQEGAENCKTS